MPRQLEELALDFVPLTSTRNVEDIEIPEVLELGGTLLEVPKALQRKDVHYVLEDDGNVVRAAWLNEAMAKVLNSFRAAPGGPLFIQLGAEKATEVRLKELQGARELVAQEVGRLVKERVIRDRSGPGLMAFVQANENVPENTVLISRRTYDAICAYNYRWRNCSKVIAVRFPNLGPGTTQKLNLVVNGHPPQSQNFERNTRFYEVGSRIKGVENLTSLLKMLEAEDHGESEEEGSGENVRILDAVYLNPKTLKEGFEGDGDGDQLFLVAHEFGKAHFKKFDMARRPGEPDPAVLETMRKKAGRTKRENLPAYLQYYFDDMPIAAVTYMIRTRLYRKAAEMAHNGSDHPMHDAWEVVGPSSIEILETVMDIRKVNIPRQILEARLRTIRDSAKEIARAREEGCWFAKTVTSPSVQDPRGFMSKFGTLQEFVDLITHQKKRGLAQLEEVNHAV